MTVPVCGVFGKLPFHGDFLRWGDDGPVELLDRWFTCLGVDHRRAPAVAAAFAAAGPIVTQFAARGRWWTVVAFPSQDSVGRRYPLFAFAGHAQDAFAGREGLLPVACAPVVQRIFRAQHEGWGGDAGGLREHGAALGAAVDIDAEESRFLDGLHAVKASAVFGQLPGADAVAGRATLVAAIARLAVQPDLAPGLRLQPMLHQLHWGFWTTLLVLLRPSGPAPTMTVLRPGADGRQPSAVLLWAPLPALGLAGLLWPGAAQAPVLADPTSGCAAATDPGPLADLLADDGLSARDLLNGLVSTLRRSPLRD